MLERYEFSETLLQKTKTWDLGNLVCSALAYRFDRKILNFLEWGEIAALLLNDVISRKLFVFLRKNKFFEVLNKNELIFGTKYMLRRSLFFGVSQNSIMNFLSFLKVDYVTSKKLAVLTLKSNNFDAILSFKKNEERVLLTQPLIDLINLIFPKF